MFFGGSNKISALTSTVALAVVIPPGPVAVIVYVVVSDGVTVVEPLKATEPIPWSMEQVSASVALQVKTEEFPSCTMVGLALIDTVGAGSVTVMVTLAVAVPPSPVAVMV